MLYKKMEKLPDSDCFNGTLNVWFERNELKSYAVLSEAEDHQGPDLIFGLGYYAPAVAARLGVKLSHCLFLLHEVATNEHGIRDNKYSAANIIGIEDDGYGRYRAEKVSIQHLNLQVATNLEGYLGAPLSKHQGKTALFATECGCEQHTIKGYNGHDYYSEEDGELKVITGSLVQVLP